MPVAQLTLEIEIHQAQSLKDRRQVVRSIRDTLRRGFNVSVAELDEAVVWNRATLGLVALSRSTTYLEGQLQQAEDAAQRACARFGAEIIDACMELLATDAPDPLSDLPRGTELTSTPPDVVVHQVTSVLSFEPRRTPEPAPHSAMVALSEESNA